METKQHMGPMIGGMQMQHVEKAPLALWRSIRTRLSNGGMIGLATVPTAYEYSLSSTEDSVGRKTGRCGSFLKATSITLGCMVVFGLSCYLGFLLNEDSIASLSIDNRRKM